MLKITFHNTSRDIAFYEPSTGITIPRGDTSVTNIKESRLSTIQANIQKMNTSNNATYLTMDYETVATQNTISPNQKGLILDALDNIDVGVTLSSDLSPDNNIWSVSDSSVLSITGNGNSANVKALKESDSCSIIVKNGTAKAFFNVKVYPELKGLSITPAIQNIGLGSSYQFSLTPIPTTARILTPLWKSSDDSIATVDSGLVKAVSLGKCNVIGSYKGFTVSSEVDITDKYTASFSTASKDISIGESYNTVLSVNKNDTPITTINPKYSTSDNSVATVDSKGKVTGVSSGKVIISAYEDTKYSTSIEINVSIVSVTGISLSPSTLNLYATNEQMLDVSIAPSNASNKGIIFKSDNTAVATVNSLGKVIAKGVGSATITGSSSDGTNITGSTKVNVLETQVSSISLNLSTQTLAIGSTSQLSANIQPDTATNKTISWSTTNSNCAVVDNSGLVTAVSSGNATIVATSNDGKKSAICVVTVNAKT